MAIVATFSADFTKWNEGLRNAQANLKPLEVSAKGLQRQLEQAARAFSGVEIRRQAEIAVAAVKSIGGASKLTTDELKKFGSTVDAAVEKLKRMGTAVPDSLTKAQHDIAEAQKAIADGSAKLDVANTKSATSFKGLVASYAAGLATFDLAKRAIGGVAEFLESSIESYAMAEKASARLTQALKNQGRAAPETKQAMDALATQFQRTTRFSDDLATEMEALFIQIGNVGPEQMDTAMTAAADLAEGLGIELEQAVTAVSKALAGNDTALRKLAPSLDDAAIKGGNLADIAGEIERHFGGQAAAQLDTYSGRVQQLANDWDNVKEAIGRAIATDPVIKASLRTLSEQLGGASDSADGLTASAIAMKAQLAQGDFASAFIIAFLRDLSNESNLAAENLDFVTRSVKSLQAVADRQLLALPLPDLTPEGMTAFAQWDKDAEAAEKRAKKLQDELKKLAEADQAWRDQITSQDAQRSLEELSRRWDQVRGSQKLTEPGLNILLDQYEGIVARLDRVNPKTAAFVEEMNRLAIAANRLPEFGIKLSQMMPDFTDLSKIDVNFGDAFKKNAEAVIKANAELDKQIRQRTLSRSAFLISEAQRVADAQIAALDPRAINFDEAVTRIKAQLADLTDAMKHEGVLQRLANRENLKAQLQDAVATYQEMVDAHQFTGKEIADQQEDVRKAVKAIEEAFGDDWKAVLKEMGIDWTGLGDIIEKSWINTLGNKLKGAFGDIANDIPNIITDALIHGASLEDTAAALGTNIGSNLGSAIGDSIAPGIGGAIGRALGSLLGPLLKKLIKSDAERAAEELGREWGITISGQMADQIEETMKTTFKDMKNNRWLSEVFHLGDIIADVGGITVKNLPALQKQLRQAFVFLDEGAFDVSDVQHVLDTSFNQFVEFFTSRNKILSKELVEIIRLNHQLGVDAKVVLDFVSQQSNRAGSALLTVFNQTGTAFAGLGQKIAAAEEAVAEARKKGSSSDIVKANAELTRLLTEQHRGAEQLGAEVNRLGGFILATFNAGIASGLSFQQALAGVQEPLKRLIDLQKDLGLDENNPALKALEVASQVASSQAGQAAAATNELILALSNIGALTFDTFKGVEEQLKDVYTRVQSEVAKAGGGTKEALQQILPSLQSIIDASQEYGFTIDANTQSLIDQAIQLGLLTGDASEKIKTEAEQLQDTNSILLLGIGALVEAIGGTLPAAFIAMRDKAEEALNGVKDSIDQLPGDVTIPIDFPRGELPRIPPEDFPDHIEIPVDVLEPNLEPIKNALLELGPTGEQAFDAIQKAMGDFQAGVPGAVDELKAAFGEVWDKLPTEARDAFQRMLNEAEAALGKGGIGGELDKLPDHIEIPIDFPTERIQIPEHPRKIDIPVNFRIEAPEAGDYQRYYGQREYAKGGPVYAASGMFIPRGTDTVPAMLTPGEYVMNRSAVNRIGSSTLDAWNRGSEGMSSVEVKVSLTIQAWDGEDVRRVLKSDPGIQKAIGDAAMKGIAKGGWGGSRFDERVRSVK